MWRANRLPGEGVEIKLASISNNVRSKQFYATRLGWEWKFHEKTRDRVGVMRAHFGHDIDAVTLLALPTSAPNRDWRRFDEQLELVDLGRHRDRANGIFMRLASQAMAERQRQERASDTPGGIVVLQLDVARRKLTAMREEVARAIKEDGLSAGLGSSRDPSRPSFANLAALEYVTTGLAAFVGELGARERTADETIRALQRATERLEREQTSQRPIDYSRGPWHVAHQNGVLDGRLALADELRSIRRRIETQRQAAQEVQGREV